MMRKIMSFSFLPGFLMLALNTCCQENERVLVVVEKVAGSVGFYSENGTHIKSLPVGELPHEMVFSPDRKRAFITNNGSFRFTDDVEGGNTVSVVNLENLELEQPIELGRFRRPHGICYDSVSGLLAVGVENPDRLLIIDPEKRQIIADYDNHGKTPHMVTLSPGAEYAYISNVQSGNVTVLNLKTNAYYSLQVGYKPQQSVRSKDGKYLYVGCDDYIAVIDLRLQRMTGTIGRGANRLELFNHDSMLVYSSTKQGFGFADTHSYKELFHLDIPYKPYSLHVSSDDKYLYLAAEEQNLIYVASPENMKIVQKIKVPDGTNPDPVMDIWLEKSKIPKPVLVNHIIPEFKRLVIDSAFSRGYQVKVADVDSDLKPDIIALSDRLPEIYWYQNPGWEKHLITNRSYRNIDIAPHDIDGDGDMDLALAARFDLNKPKEGGYIYWLENPGDISREWNMFLIDSIPTSHRVRWADVNGNGRKELINVPLIGYDTGPPDYEEPAIIRGYIVPQEPGLQAWEKIEINNSLHMVHGVSVVRWNDDIRDDLLTASFEGVYLHESNCNTRYFGWKDIKLGVGKRDERPLAGSSEIAIGYVNNTKPFLAAIEPWHGNEVVVYYPGNDHSKTWGRVSIDSSFNNGHAIQCADFNFDGNYEIVAGFRGAPYHLYLYWYDTENHSWQRTLLDEGGMSAAGISIFDYNGDGFPDIVACGSETGNVVLYENLKVEIPRNMN